MSDSYKYYKANKAIAEQKRIYAEAQKIGDRKAMDAAHKKAEMIRKDAGMASGGGNRTYQDVDRELAVYNGDINGAISKHFYGGNSGGTVRTHDVSSGRKRGVGGHIIKLPTDYSKTSSVDPSPYKSYNSLAMSYSDRTNNNNQSVTPKNPGNNNHQNMSMLRLKDLIYNKDGWNAATEAGYTDMADYFNNANNRLREELELEDTLTAQELQDIYNERAYRNIVSNFYEEDDLENLSLEELKYLLRQRRGL